MRDRKAIQDEIAQAEARLAEFDHERDRLHNCS